MMKRIVCRSSSYSYIQYAHNMSALSGLWVKLWIQMSKVEKSVWLGRIEGNGRLPRSLPRNPNLKDLRLGRAIIVAILTLGQSSRLKTQRRFATFHIRKHIKSHSLDNSSHSAPSSQSNSTLSKVDSHFVPTWTLVSASIITSVVML